MLDPATSREPGEATPERFWFSQAFGLTLRSDFPIHELVQADPQGLGAHDIDIVRSSGLIRPERDEAGAWFSLRQDGGEPIDELHWKDVGSFRIRGDDRIEYEARPSVSNDLLSLPLLGIVMAVVLHQRGLLVLHGSAVEIDGEAVVFLGDKGAGKSTTAASLVSAGRRILTDDVVALDLREDGRPRLWPGFGQVKLNDDASRAIVLAGSRILERPHEDFPKHRHDLSAGFDLSAIPVSDIFVLERGETTRSIRLEGHQVVMALMRYAYLARFGADFFKGGQAAALLQACGQTARRTWVGRLEVPSDLVGLARLNGDLAVRRSAAAASR